jgi:hypothetical protein
MAWMGGECSMLGEYEKCIQTFSREEWKEKDHLSSPYALVLLKCKPREAIETAELAGL